jgi:dCMP deaminase
MAYRIAENLSTDPSTQNGAILVNPHTGFIVSHGANHFPRCVKETPERWERPLKYSYVEHAERNCIYLAAQMGVPTNGIIMYCPWFACADCARAIIQAGIAEVVGHDYNQDGSVGSSSRWTDSVEIGDQMLTEAGVKFRRLPGKIGGVKIRFNGGILEP